MDKPDVPKADKRISPDGETGTVSMLSDLIECPLCAGRGKLGRIEFYEKTGMRDPSRIAELSASHAATQAVQTMHDKLWSQYKENLDKQVKAEAATLNNTVERLKQEQADLVAKNRALEESIAPKEQAARNAQKNDDQAALLTEKKALQDEIATLKGHIEETRAKLEAMDRQRSLDVKEAEESVKGELNERINQLNEALLYERKQKAEFQTKLERAESETKQRQHEAKAAAYAEKQKELDGKQSDIDTMKQELAELRAEVKNFPSQESVAVQQAINEHELKLRKLELERDNVQKERDRLKEDLAEARQKLEASKGPVEERTFEAMVAGVPGVWIEDWRSKKESGDYHIGLYDKDGDKLVASKIVVDNKDVGRLTPKEIDKLVRDARKQKVALAAMVVSDESALRPEDIDARFGLAGGITLLRTTRAWFLRDLDLLRPLMRRQAEEGPDFMNRNIAVAAEVRSHLKTLDKVEKHMRLARENAESAEKELRKYRTTVDDLCRGGGSARSHGATEDDE